MSVGSGMGLGERRCWAQIWGLGEGLWWAQLRTCIRGLRLWINCVHGRGESDGLRCWLVEGILGPGGLRSSRLRSLHHKPLEEILWVGLTNSALGIGFGRYVGSSVGWEFCLFDNER